MTKETSNVEGMSCGHCQSAVEDELDRLSGVERGTVEVVYDEDHLTTVDIENAVQQAGYTLIV
ncbi:MAG: heavy-metal-associated domain-containing protein [Rubrobacter sp.]